MSFIKSVIIFLNSRWIMLATLFLIFSSCVFIQINSAGYEFMSKKDKEYVVITSPQRSICTLKNEGAVYSITGKQLKKCLAGYDSSVVYLWAPRCSSPNCVLIPAFHDACLRKGYTSFVVAEYYDIRIMKAQNITESPIFAFNTEYYGTERVGKLIKLFFRDLLLHPYSYKEYGYGRYLVFHSDSLVRVADNIENDL